MGRIVSTILLSFEQHNDRINTVCIFRLILLHISICLSSDISFNSCGTHLYISFAASYLSQMTNNGRMAYLHLKRHFSRYLSLIIFHNFSSNVIIDGIFRPSSWFVLWWKIASRVFRKPTSRVFHKLTFNCLNIYIYLHRHFLSKATFTFHLIIHFL